MAVVVAANSAQHMASAIPAPLRVLTNSAQCMVLCPLKPSSQGLTAREGWTRLVNLKYKDFFLIT
eukprot:1148242-Pelagomonas_calceolata.AAC.3